MLYTFLLGVATTSAHKATDPWPTRHIVQCALARGCIGLTDLGEDGGVNVLLVSAFVASSIAGTEISGVGSVKMVCCAVVLT